MDCYRCKICEEVFPKNPSPDYFKGLPGIPDKYSSLVGHFVYHHPDLFEKESNYGKWPRYKFVSRLLRYVEETECLEE